jgi:hypothetical protein
MKTSEQQEDSPVSIHVGCGDYLVYSLRMRPHQYTTHGIRSQAHFHFVQQPSTELEEKIITVYPILHPERSLFHMQCDES